MKHLFLLPAILLISISVFSQAKEFKKVDLDDLIVETQLSTDDPDSMDLVWWIPNEYWTVIFEQDDTASAAEVQEVITALDQYSIFIVVKGKIGPFGGVKFKSEKEVKNIVNVKYRNEKLVLMEEEDMDEYVTSFLTVMKPMLKNILGPMGDSMHFLVYSQQAESGNFVDIDPYGNDNIHVSLNDDINLEFNLPLASLIKDKICPKTNKSLNGTWNYCPHDGAKLISKE